MRKCNGREWAKVNTFWGSVNRYKSLILKALLEVAQVIVNNLGGAFVKDFLIEKG
jgi:hypothetical protein